MQRELYMNIQGLLMDISAYIMHVEALFQCCRPGVAQLAVAQLDCLPVVCRSVGLSPR